MSETNRSDATENSIHNRMRSFVQQQVPPIVFAGLFVHPDVVEHLKAMQECRQVCRKKPVLLESFRVLHQTSGDSPAIQFACIYIKESRPLWRCLA